MPDGPDEGDGMGEGGALPVVPARSPRRLSLGDGDAGTGAVAGRRVSGGYAGLRDPFSNEHAYVEDYEPSYSSTGGYDSGVRDGGGAWYAHQAPASEWPLRNEVGGQLGRKGRPLWDRVYDGT